MKIEVTAEDIESGVGHNEYCPVARACKRAIGANAVVLVYPTKIHVYTHRGASGTFEVPYEAKLFIAKFDNGAMVEPFSFELV